MKQWMNLNKQKKSWKNLTTDTNNMEESDNRFKYHAWTNLTKVYKPGNILTLEGTSMCTGKNLTLKENLLKNLTMIFLPMLKQILYSHMAAWDPV